MCESVRAKYKRQYRSNPVKLLDLADLLLA
jgi:hypothetical protein